MAKTSSDVTTWLPSHCCRCGRPVRRSKEGFGASYAGTGTTGEPVSLVWHLPACPDEKHQPVPHRDLGPKVKAG